MVPRFLAVSALAMLALAPEVASAGIPVVMYPLRAPGLSASQRAELHGLIEAALASAARRGILAPRSPLLLAKTCGDIPQPACLAQAGKGGLVLAGRGEFKNGIVFVTAALWDGHGNRTREVRFLADLVIQNLRPIGEAIMELEMEIEPDGRVTRDLRMPSARDPHGRALPKPPPAAVAAAIPREPSAAPKSPPPKTSAAEAFPEPRTEAPVAPRTEAPVPPRTELSAAPRPEAPVVARAEIPAEPRIDTRAEVHVETRGPPPLWRRKAGPWLTGIGAVLLGGGAAVAYLNRNLTSDLDAKYASGALTESDRSSYDRVKMFNLVSTALFAAGGVVGATGTWLWISAPAAPGGPAVIGAGGRF